MLNQKVVLEGISMSNTQESKVLSDSKLSSFESHRIVQTNKLRGGSIGESDTVIDIYVIKE